MNENEIFSQFKELIIDMRRGFPKYYYRDDLDEYIPTSEVRDILFANDIFVKSTKASHEGQIFLGPKGLDYANSFIVEDLTKNMEVLTKEMKKWTRWITYLTISLVVLTIVIILLTYRLL